MVALEGDPAALRRCAEVQERAARATDVAAEQLQGIAQEQVSLAFDAVHRERLHIVAALEPLRQQHALTASVLADYATALDLAQRRASEADTLRNWADTERRDTVARLGSLDWRYAAALATADSPGVVDLELRIAAARERLDWLDRLQGQSMAEQLAAERDRDVAAETAIARLNSLPYGDAAARQLELLVAIDTTIARIATRWEETGARLRTVMNAFDRASEHALGMLWETLLVAGALSLGGRLLVGVTRPLEHAMLGAIAGLLAAFVVTSITSDVRAPTPQIKQLRPQRVRTPHGLGEALIEAAEVDALGRAERTVVKITAVPGADGVTRWRVVLPSTQDWGTGPRDAGAVNDVDSNLALLLAPQHQTQYERAVLDAMQHAGIGPDDPVLLIGFSQGGIMASHLAAHRDGHQWAGVIAAGAPIDSMPIPPSVDVVALEHLGDPVTRLEADLGLPSSRPHHSDWTTVRVASAGSTEGIPGIHSATHYDATLRRHAGAIATRHPGIAAFYPDHHPNSSTARYYAWHE